MLAPCPQCSQIQTVHYIVIKVESCGHCGHYAHYRAPAPAMTGGLNMITYLTARTLERKEGVPALTACLARALAKAKRRQAKRQNKHHGGSPKQAKDWR